MILKWQNLENIDDLDKAIKESNKQFVAIFKHSTRCGTSHFAKEKLESEVGLIESNINFYYLDLIRFRNISNEIAERFQVIHQSPQILIFKDEEVVFHTSHLAIGGEKINESLAKIKS